MIALTLDDIAAIVGGELRAGSDTTNADRIVSGSVETDSRKVTPGSIFFAMPGEVTDGHLFADAAVAGGAALIVAERPLDLPIPLIVVEHGVTALADLAREVVARVRARGELRVVAVTGSNGKTTTKNMLREILARDGATIAPQGSFNNHVGAPISMLRIDENTRYLVVEMGASGPGEIAHLVSIVRPDVAIVLKVGLAHAGGFGDIEQTARAKAEIVTELDATALAILNADDARVRAMAEQTRARVEWFGLESGPGVRARNAEATASGTRFELLADEVSAPVRLRILGEHHVMNALAALTAARELGIELPVAIAALESMERAERWRMELLRSDDGPTIINDAYNASPDSMSAALRTLAQIAGRDGRSVAVLGEMAELGPFTVEEHDRIGRLVVRLNIGRLVVVGHEARHIHLAAGLEGSWDGESILVDTAEQAYDVLRDQLRSDDIVLVKSSNSAGLRHLGDRLAGVSA